ncbi:MAG TPA: MFS transporter [Methylomirabilota bacterium]|nr:MFS transporter [Methylomirabilota bacterium]
MRSRPIARKSARAYAGALPASAVLYAVFALPAFIVLPQPPRGRVSVPKAAREGGAEVLATARKILAMRDLRRFLGAYFIYEDGVNTVVAFSAIFAAQTLDFPMERLIGLYIVVQVSALLGALAWACPTDRLGPHRVVMITLCQWSVIVVAAYFVQTQAQFWVLAVVAGTGLGAVQAASRAFMARLAPRGMEAELFASTRSAARARRCWARSSSAASPTRRAATSGPASSRSGRSSSSGSSCSRGSREAGKRNR